jgi:hypothetical protein
MNTITIKTKLHDGVYVSQGGGKVVTHYEFTAGPRNLVKAIKTLHSHKDEIKECFGNIGCGHSWMEINGKQVNIYDMEDVMKDDAEAFGPNAPASMIKTRTEKARELLADYAK